MGEAFKRDRIAIEFLGTTAAEAAIIAQECARRLQEAGVRVESIMIARSQQDAMDLGGVLVILGGFGLTFIESVIKGAGEANRQGCRTRCGQGHREAAGDARARPSVHLPPVRITGSSGTTWTIGGEFGRAPLAAGADGSPGFGKLGIVILGASAFPYMNDATLNNPALARSAQLAKSLFGPPNTAFTGAAVLDLFDSEKQPVEVLDAIERHVDAHPDMRDLVIYYCGHAAVDRPRWFAGVCAVPARAQAQAGAGRSSRCLRP